MPRRSSKPPEPEIIIPSGSRVINSPYSSDIKSKVMADAASGMSQLALVRKYELPRSTIRGWVKGLGSPSVASELKEELDAEVLRLVISSVKTLRAILRHARKTEWLDEQTANGLAVFYGVTTDKLTAVLAAFERGREIEEALLLDEAGEPGSIREDSE